MKFLADTSETFAIVFIMLAVYGKLHITTVIYHENTKERKHEKESNVYISFFRCFALSC
jgi:hypothetical protein